MNVKTQTKKTTTPLDTNGLTTLSKWFAILGIVLLTLSGYMYYRYVYLGTDTVFSGMLAQSLRTTSYTRTDTTKGQDGATQTVHNQVQFGADTFVRRLTTVSQDINGQKNSVQREALGTPKLDFERLVQVNLPSQPDAAQPYKETIGKWVRMTPEGSVTNQYLSETIFGIIPMAPLQPSQQQELYDYMQEQQVYEVSTTVPVKQETIADKKVYVYRVVVRPQAYIRYLEKFASAVGLKESAQFDPNQYDASDQIEIDLAVNPRSRQIIEVRYPENQARTERYSSYGILNEFVEPEVTLVNPQTPNQNR